MTLWPTIAFGQGVKAGVVTALEGSVTARRVALPDPLSLKFKDDVLLNDRITTGDRSIARLLLGGKAAVTIRERSTLAITETPGRSTVDLASGKIALAVARGRMRPAEVVEIRTPNAIAAVRGTVVIAEVLQVSAQLGRPAGGTVTNFYVLRGRIAASQLDPSTRAPIGQTFSIQEREGFRAAGAAPPTVAPIPDAQMAQITSGLQTSGPQHEAVAGQAKIGAIEQTEALLGALFGGSTLQGSTAALVTTSPAIITDLDPTAPQSSVLFPPILPGGAGFGSSPPPVLPPLLPAGDVPEIELLRTTVTLAPGETLKSYTGETNRAFSSAVVRIGEATVSQLGADNFIEVMDGATVTLASPLLEVEDSKIATGANLLDVAGNLTGNTTARPLLSFDPSLVTAVGSLVNVTGSLTVAGGLVSDVDGLIMTGDRLVRVSGVLKSAGDAPLLGFSGTSVVSPPGVMLVAGVANLDGPLLVAGPGTTVETRVPSDAVSLLTVAPGGVVVGTSPSALIQFHGATWQGETDLGERLASGVIVAGGDGLSGLLTVQGSLLGITDASGVRAGALLKLLDGGRLVAGTAQHLIQVAGSDLLLASVAVIAGASSGITPADLDLQGGLLLAADSTVTTTGDVVVVRGGMTVRSTASAFIQLVGGSLEGAGALLSGDGTGATSPASIALPMLLDVSGGATVDVDRLLKLNAAMLESAGPLARLRTGADVTSRTSFIGLGANAKLVATLGGEALVSLNGSRLTVKGDYLATVADGSLLSVPSGHLVALASDSRLTIETALLLVSGGSVFELRDGSLGIFGSGRNLLQLSTAPCTPSTCVTLPGGFKVLLINGALTANVMVDPGFVVFAGDPGDSVQGDLLIVLDGAASKILLGPNPVARIVDLLVTEGTTDFSTGVPQTFATVTITGGTLSGSDTVTSQGAFRWTGGLMSGTGKTVAADVATIGGEVGLDAGRVLELHGTTTWTLGTIDLNPGPLGGSGRIDNLAGALFIAQGDDLMTGTHFGDVAISPPVFNNAGTFRKSGGTGTTTIGGTFPSVEFNNSGLVEVLTGTLALLGGGTATGAFTVAEGATLRFAPCCDGYTLAEGSEVHGLGTVAFAGGTTVIGGDYHVDTTLVSGGTASFEGRARTGDLVQTGGVLAGSGTVMVTDELTWVGGSMNGPGKTVVLGGATISGKVALDAGRVLALFGTTSWTSGIIDLKPSTNLAAGRIENAVYASFIASGNGAITATDLGGPAPVFSNAGTFQRSGWGTTTVGVQFDNTGLVEVLGGTLNLTRSGSSDGTFAVSHDAMLRFAGGTYELRAGSLQGSGDVKIAAGIVRLADGGIYRLTGQTTVTGGTLMADGDFIALGEAETLRPLGSILTRTGGTVNIQGAFLDVSIGGTLESYSSAPLLLLNGGTHTLATATGASIFRGAGRYPDHDGHHGHGHGYGRGHDGDHRQKHGRGYGYGHDDDEYDRPIRHAGVLLETSGASVTTQKVLKLDAALFEATAPIIYARAGSQLAVAGDALELSLKAKLTSQGAVLRLDASTLAVASGSFINLSGGSVMRIAGNLLQLSNGSLLRLLNGPIIRVAGGSVLDVTGGLAYFGGTGGNRISVSNNVCNGACQTFQGIPVFFQNGATPANLAIGPNPLKNPDLGSLTTSGPGAAAIILDGPTSRVSIGGR